MPESTVQLIFKIDHAWIPVALGISGTALLFYASVVLIRETRVALWAVDKEMDHAVHLFEENFSDMAAAGRHQWWKKLLFIRRNDD